MSNPTITAVEVIEPTGIHDLSGTHVSTVKVDLEWVVGENLNEKCVLARLTIPEARAWIDSLERDIKSIEKLYA